MAMRTYTTQTSHTTTPTIGTNAVFVRTTPAYSKASRGTVYTLARQIAVRETQVLGMPISPYDVLTWIELRLDGFTFSTLTLSNAI